MRIRLNPIDRLIQVLQGQRTVYAALLQLYKDNHKAMQEWDLVALKPLFAQEQKLLRELQLLEQRRSSTVAQLNRELSVNISVDKGEQSSGVEYSADQGKSELLASLTMGKLLELLEENAELNKNSTGSISSPAQRRNIKQLGEEILSSMSKIEDAREPLLSAIEAALGYLERNDTQPPSATPYSKPGDLQRQTESRILDKKL
jgi:hypothetical protein